MEIKRELNQTLLIREVSGLYKEDYQMRMFKENHIEGFLSVRGRGIEEKSIYEYDISEKISMKTVYEKKKITAREMKNFLYQLRSAIEKASEYFLDVNHIMLEPEYIFCENEKFAFCYFPESGKDIWIEFHKLMEYFVQWTDYQDSSSVKTAFLLHKETMEENYSLKRIIDKIEEGEKYPEETYETMRRAAREKRQEQLYGEESESSYETAEHDWITSQEMGSKILRETDNLWTPVKRFLQKHRKPKWGDWDGIYIDDEEF